MSTHYITSERNITKYNIRGEVGEVEPVTVDFRPWANDVTSVTWTTNGSVSVYGDALDSSVATANLSYSNECIDTVKVKGVSTTKGTRVIYISVKVGSESAEDYI